MVARRAWALAGGALLVAGCGSGRGSGTTARPDIRRPPEAGAVLAALAPLPGAGLRAGELTTGIVRDVLLGGRPAGGPAARVIIRLPVSTGGQRGLLGLAVDRRGSTFAAFTTTGPGERLVVEQVAPGPRRRVWTGPRSTDLADGGHLALRAGRLVIGIGDLEDPARIADPEAPNGKLLSLDPAGPATQRPRILSRGWNNPFAFAVVPGTGAVLVADNAPGTRPERIGRGDAGGGAPRQVTALRKREAPSGLVVLGATRIAVCGVRSGRLTRYRRVAGRWRAAGVLAADCSFGVARLSDGRLVLSTARGLRVIAP